MNKLIFFITFTTSLLLSGTAHAMCGGGLAFYEKRSNGWYYYNKKVEGADPENFHVLPGTGSDVYYNPCARDSGYAVDKLHVYKGTKILPSADPATFSFLTAGYSRDASHVYYLETILNGADVKTFKQITSGYFKDSAHVYLNGVSIKDADPTTFSILDNNPPGTGLAHDATHVFFGASAISNANPKDVKSLGRQYWKSNQTIFFADKSLAQIDSATFSVAKENELAFSAEDKNHYFLGGRALSKSECNKVGEIILACKNYVLASGHKYSQVDATSLHYLGRSILCENSMIYQDTHNMYEVYGDGTIWKFLSFQADRKFENLDKMTEKRLCDNQTKQSLLMDR